MSSLPIPNTTDAKLSTREGRYCSQCPSPPSKGNHSSVPFPQTSASFSFLPQLIPSVFCYLWMLLNLQIFPKSLIISSPYLDLVSGFSSLSLKFSNFLDFYKIYQNWSISGGGFLCSWKYNQ